MSDKRNDDSFIASYNRHVDTVYRVCYTYLRNAADAEDAAQNVFIKLLARPVRFESVEHERAWLIRVATNYCKDALKAPWAQRFSLEDVPEPTAADTGYDETLDAMMKLPENQRLCAYLYYYEGYKTVEIAEILKCPHSTVRNNLSEARTLLRRRIGRWI